MREEEKCQFDFKFEKVVKVDKFDFQTNGYLIKPKF